MGPPKPCRSMTVLASHYSASLMLGQVRWQIRGSHRPPSGSSVVTIATVARGRKSQKPISQPVLARGPRPERRPRRPPLPVSAVEEQRLLIPRNLHLRRICEVVPPRCSGYNSDATLADAPPLRLPVNRKPLLNIELMEVFGPPLFVSGTLCEAAHSG